MTSQRLPRHVGIIPDGHRRWAEARGLPREAGYAHGIEPGIRALALLRELGVAEVSIYGFTKENVRRPTQQVRAFQAACVEFADRAIAAGAALLVVGDHESSAMPAELRPFAQRRSPGTLRVNLLANYGWRWDLFGGRADDPLSRNGNGHAAGAWPRAMGSAAVPRIDLVMRWGGCTRLSGFLPVQCAYADLRVIDSLWPDMVEEELVAAIGWYQLQDVTLGG